MKLAQSLMSCRSPTIGFSLSWSMYMYRISCNPHVNDVHSYIASSLFCAQSSYSIDYALQKYVHVRCIFLSALPRWPGGRLVPPSPRGSTSTLILTSSNTGWEIYISTICTYLHVVSIYRRTISSWMSCSGIVHISYFLAFIEGQIALDWVTLACLESQDLTQAIFRSEYVHVQICLSHLHLLYEYDFTYIC